MQNKTEPNRKLRYWAVLGVITSLVLMFFYVKIWKFLIRFFETYFSDDHQIKWETQWYIGFWIVFLIVVLLVISWCNYFNRWGKIMDWINSVADMKKAFDFFTTDELSSNKNYSGYVFFIGPFFGIIYFVYFLVFGIPKQEGLVENSNSVFILLAIILLLVSVIHIKKPELNGTAKRKILTTILLVSAFFILVLGEEISWGQHIFHWKAEGVFDSGYNFQRETNLHNFLNPLFRYVYPLVGISTFLVLFLIWFFAEKSTNYLYNLFLPHRNTFLMVYLMACTSCLYAKETYEELVAIFFLMYSIRIYMCLKYPATLKPHSVDTAD